MRSLITGGDNPAIETDPVGPRQQLLSVAVGVARRANSEICADLS